MLKHFLKLLIILSLISGCETGKKESSTENLEFSNTLDQETSPYLLQHANNPVFWKAWNDETLQLAQDKDKLIVISIGYAACHWCHVMEEESFEDDTVAKLMNENFINIKVDREERPDIDKIYMNAVQLITGNAGWPLNVVALPDGRPIFGGTYFTKEQWLNALQDLSKVYRETPEKAISYAEKLTKGIQESGLIELNNDEAVFDNDDVIAAVESWKNQLDFENGGQLGEQKFPTPTNLEFLMRYSVQNDDAQIASYVKTTLDKMAFGGIYDQVGGGFSRYSTDENWHIPHFEKMLYDNAQLVSLYSDAYLLYKDPMYQKVVDETVEFVDQHLTDPSGAFYSSLDADSKNGSNSLEEGIFYAWTLKELQQVITQDFELFKSYYQINDYGKWENDLYVLIRKEDDLAFAKANNISIKQLHTSTSQWRKSLYEARQLRPKPRTDDKSLTSWNALMLKGYADAFRVFRNKELLSRAKASAAFILQNQIRPDGGLNHNYKGGKSTINGYAEDYGVVTDAFLSLYKVTLDEKWLKTARALTDYAMIHFYDTKSGMFFFTSNEDQNLISRKIEVVDQAIPSSNSVMAHNLFELGHYYANKNYTSQARQMLNNMKVDIQEAPSGYANWLHLMLNYSKPYYEVAISGREAIKKTERFQAVYLPNTLIVGASKESIIPLLENRFSQDQTYIYVCVNGTCKLPLVKVEEAIDLIKL